MSPTIYVSLLLCAAQASVQGFSINLPTHILGLYNPSAALSSKEAFIGVPVANGHGRYVLFSSSSSSDGENEEESKRNVNPYADPNYPDLEFVNYDDPEYAAGQGDDEYYDSSVSPMSTDEEIEAMREDRRRRNDEYQFQTYWTNVWGAGKVEYKGEWTVYYSSKFFPEVDDSPNNDLNDDDMPRLIQASDAPLSVISSASKEFMEADEGYDNPVDFERILHAQRLEQMMGDAELAAAGTDETEQGVLRQTYWPQQLAAKDFRGAPGIMVCGK